MKKKLSSLSIFLPCYNEEQNIEIIVDKINKLLPQISNDYELILIDDGSTDNTKKIIKDLSNRFKHIKNISHKKNMGYGMALRTGFNKATKDWIFFTDSDLQFNINELKKFIKYTKQYEVIVGHRINRAEGGIRNINAKLFKLFINLLFRVHVKDIDCAFKIFKKEVVKNVNLKSTGAMISSELLYKIKKMKIEVKEIPVKHYNRKFGTPTGSNIFVILKAIYEAINLYISIKIEYLLNKRN